MGGPICFFHSVVINLSRFSSKVNGFVNGAAAATTSFYSSLILKDGDDWLGVMIASLNYF